MDIIKTLTLIVIAGVLASGLYFYIQKDTVFVVEGTTIPVTVNIPEIIIPEPSFGVIPTVFIATPSTTTDPTNFGFLIGTSTNATDNGSTTLAVYGSTTLQTYIDTEFAFQVLNSATTSIFQVDTLNSSTTANGAFYVNELTVDNCTGCGGGAADPNVIILPVGTTEYLQASTTDNAWNFDDGFVSQASSTMVGRLGIGADVIPDSDGTRDLGENGAEFARLWVDQIFNSAISTSFGAIQLNFDPALFRVAMDIAPGGSSKLKVLSSGVEVPGNFNGSLAPTSDSLFDFGGATLFWDEGFADEYVLGNGGTGATAANTVRLGGLDLSAGDAAALITTEDDTEHVFGSKAGIATTSPYAKLTVWQDTTAENALAFEIVDHASTTLFSVDDNGHATTTGNLRVVGTLDSSDIAFRNLVDNEVIFTFTEGDRVGEDKTDLILVNMQGKNVFVFKQDGTLIAKNIVEKSNYLYLLGLLGLLGLIPRRKK